MVDDSTVNSQITDSVTQGNTTVVGQSVSVTQGMLDTVMAETIGMGLYNAVSAQQSSQMTSHAAVTTACARMLQAPIPIKTPPPTPPPEKSVTPLEEPTPESREQQIAAASEKAETAIQDLLRLEQETAQTTQDAKTDLKALIDKILKGLPYKLTEASLQLLEKKLGKSTALLTPILNKEYANETSFLEGLGFGANVQNTIAISAFDSSNKEYQLTAAAFKDIQVILKQEQEPKKYAYVLAMLGAYSEKPPASTENKAAFMQSVEEAIELQALLGAAKPDMSLKDLLALMSQPHSP